MKKNKTEQQRIYFIYMATWYRKNFRIKDYLIRYKIRGRK